MTKTQSLLTGRDHGGGLDAAIAAYGGDRSEWIDLSTGINPNPYPFQPVSFDAWTDLPDSASLKSAEDAARAFWDVPETAGALLVPGLSVAIAQLPFLLKGKAVSIEDRTYNEYRAAFMTAGWTVKPDAAVRVFVSPNNPTGDWADPDDLADRDICIIDESFADTDPERSLIRHAARKNVLVLKGLGKFWGLAGLRFGAVFGDPAIIKILQQRLGPWCVSGPSLQIAAQALADATWAQETRANLANKSQELDALMAGLAQSPATGTNLFRLYQVSDALSLHRHLAEAFILTRVFPYDPTLIRLGLWKNGTERGRLAEAVRKFESP